MKRIPHLGHRRGNQRGTTLVEAGVVLAITAILATSAAPGLRELVDKRRLDGAATLLAADLQAARIEAIARNAPVRLAFDTTQACWVLHTGAAGGCTCNAIGPAICSAGASVLRAHALPAAEGVTLAANVGAIAFDPVLGTSTPAATLRLVGSGGREIRHVVNVMGRTRSCVAGGTLVGWRGC